MNILLLLPAFLYLCTLDRGLRTCFRHLSTIVLLQLLFGSPFILQNPAAYFSGAFDLSRSFLFKWTVNWRFVREDIFASRPFALALLEAHVALLLVLASAWSRSHGGFWRVVARTISGPHLPSAISRARLDPRCMSKLLPTRHGSAHTILSSDMFQVWASANLVGVLCARSLHYQFYAWYAHHAVFLALSSRYPIYIK